MVEKVWRATSSLYSGCRLTQRNQGDQYRRAEILGIRDTKSGRHFYCNFDNFNKRLDEWVPVSRIDFDQDIEWPNPDKDKAKDTKGKKGTSQPSKKTVPSKKGQKRKLEQTVSSEGPQKRRREQSVASETPTPHPWSGKCSSTQPVFQPTR